MRTIAALLIGALVAACGPETKHELLARADAVETKAELERALGAPDELTRLGPIETWTYEAADGSVTFLITGERVALQATGEPAPR